MKPGFKFQSRKILCPGCWKLSSPFVHRCLLPCVSILKTPHSVLSCLFYVKKRPLTCLWWKTGGDKHSSIIVRPQIYHNKAGQIHLSAWMKSDGILMEDSKMVTCTSHLVLSSYFGLGLFFPFYWFILMGWY